MSMKNYKNKLDKVISKVLKIPLSQLSKKISMSNHNKWDSLNHLNLILSIEKEFGLKFDQKEIFLLINLDKIYKSVEKKIK